MEKDYYITIENVGTFYLGKFKSKKEAEEKAFERFPELEDGDIRYNIYAEN